MPSLYQLNGKLESPAVKQKKVYGAVFVWIFILLGIGIGGAYWFSKPNLVKIPDKVAATIKQSEHYHDLFKTPIKKIVWLDIEDGASNLKKYQWEKLLKYEKLNKFYGLAIRSVETLYPKCKNSNCIDIWLSKNCYENVCILFPQKKVVLKTNWDNLLEELHKHRAH